MLRFFKNGAYLDTFGHCTLDGSKRQGAYHPGDDAAGDGLEETLQRRESLRQFLVHIIGEKHLQLALELFALGKTCEEFASEIVRSPGAACRRKQKLTADIKGKLLAALAATKPEELLGKPELALLDDYCRAAVYEAIITALHQNKHRATVDLHAVVPIQNGDRCSSLRQHERRFESFPSSDDVWGYVKRHQACLFAARFPAPLRLWFELTGQAWFLGCVRTAASQSDTEQRPDDAEESGSEFA